MILVEETQPLDEDLPVAALRAWLRLGSGFELAPAPEEDRALAGFLRAAILTIEGRTGKVLLRRSYRMVLDDWRDRMGHPLPLAPVHRLDGVSIEDGAGRAREIDPAQYELVPDTQRPLLRPRGAMLPQVPRLGRVSVRFVAGFGEVWEDVPADLAQAAIMLAGRYYEDRGLGGPQIALPVQVSALIERWRSVRVLGGRGAGARR
ncbi:MAG: hypothetical protein Q4F71_03030 [Paracoccus sp. (in: a-proteobacteria)]|nr:hypothetical protein [Paracoccus sp. (in: a-proteobacteria)]